ncbi:MAG: response regulator [Verrucomicrobia bacterium]|nr:response regulator [Verrucomicrobiota bacterium]
MPYSTPPPERRSFGHRFAIGLGLALSLLFFLATGVLDYQSKRSLVEGSERVRRTHDVMMALNAVLQTMQDAETGQRGFLLTGEESYLEPYLRARSTVDGRLAQVGQLVSDNSSLQATLSALKGHVRDKFDEMEETIRTRRTSGLEAARAIVVTDRGKVHMDALRERIAEMIAVKLEIRTGRVAAMNAAYQSTIVTGVIISILGGALSITVAILLYLAAQTRQRQEWLQTGSLGLAGALSGDRNAEQLGESALGYLAAFLGAHGGILYVRKGDHFRRVAQLGVPTESATPERVVAGEGLLGEAVRTNRVVEVPTVPEGYLTIGSGLGQGRPQRLLIAPAEADGVVQVVYELGFLRPLPKHAAELLERVSEAMAVAFRSADYRNHLQELLEETQRQSEELQAQSEELRVSNEELEEQSRALRDSQSRLEQQQSELEQTNLQLEEQTRLLAAQRDDLARAQSTVQAKAEELERSNRYKSDFLANMSHELRTPLNSSLILSKLLADNPTGNLTEEQVRHAQTIQSAGNDLLALINDILDLSKIEAGYMEIHPEPVTISRLLHDLTRVFEPVAKQRGLTFRAQLAEGTPGVLESDRQRLDQILRNLLSNAFKFTQQGSVELTVRKAPNGALAFAVRDTGIGIAPEHREAIFEAFRQADGKISRRFGGTGLGLSISRELARLLGGSIQLESELGEGSTFTLLLPVDFAGRPPLASDEAAATRVRPSAPALPMAESEPARGSAAVAPRPLAPPPFQDDRDTLKVDARVILVVEDDPAFARILFDLAHENGFQCLVSRTAEDALAIARQYLPHAVLLDVGLPDHSGLSVLDRLKHDRRTRHIPIHVISASDYTATALSLGAIGYLLKPVKREDLVRALQQIEARVVGGRRRVLVVEDDAVQRDSISRLLASPDVEIVAVGTAADCLARLRESTFDCMVLDLSLPDASGFSLLETLSEEDSYAFPPVIVYTGRDLRGGDEQRLMKYSKSIIIKGAKSPERLLDEVTLFLHRVVAELPQEQQRMLEVAQNRDAILEGRRILVVEDDVRNVYSLTNILEPRGAKVQIARNGREALEALEASLAHPDDRIDLVLMDVMMPEMDGLTATRTFRQRAEWKKLPVIMLTAKAMKNDQARCLEAGANDYMAKPLDVEKLLSLVRVWMPRN